MKAGRERAAGRRRREKVQEGRREKRSRGAARAPRGDAGTKPARLAAKSDQRERSWNPLPSRQRRAGPSQPLLYPDTSRSAGRVPGGRTRRSSI